MDTLLRYNEINDGNDAKEMTKLKKVHPNLHHWLKKFHAEIDTNGKKKLLAEKKMKKIPIQSFRSTVCRGSSFW